MYIIQLFTVCHNVAILQLHYDVTNDILRHSSAAVVIDVCSSSPLSTDTHHSVVEDLNILQASLSM